MNYYQDNKTHFWIRIISILLVMMLISEKFLGSGSIVLAAQQNETVTIEESDTENKGGVTTEELISEGYTSENLDILFELKENREQSTKHYRLSDGSIMAADYGMDIHYQKNGEWADIDNRFVYEAPSVNDSMEGFATSEGDVKFKFAPDAVNGDVVKVSIDDYAVGFEFLGEATTDSEISEEDTLEGELSVQSEMIQENDTANISEDDTDTQNLEIVEQENSVPISFIKGDILNIEVAEEALSGTTAEASLDVFSVGEEHEITAIAGLLSGETTAESGNNSVDTEAESSGPAVVWAEVGVKQMDASEDDSLMKQAALENVITSVGYGNVLSGISLQYVAYGNSMKEYILVNEPKESYEYEFKMSLDNLVPAMQEDGNILLLDTESGDVVYEIPAAFMTDANGAYSEEVEMELILVQDGTYILNITADEQWINAEERVFPVQIDPTLNERLTSSECVRGNYVREGEPTVSSTNYGEMFVGYDSSGNKNMKTYIQLRNLPELPKDSVICTAVFNMAVLKFSQVAWPRLHIQAKEVKNTSWDSKYTWNNKPTSESLIIDQQTITSEELYKYVGWNITSLVKAHYDAGNVENKILAFSLEAYGTMKNLACANTALNLLWDGGEPIFQIFYRDTRGVEDYYTYQTQSLGNAGTGYISDYNSQLTVAKTIASYNSTIMPYEIGLVHNSTYSEGYFTNGGDIHSKDFSKMVIGTGWKLNIQQTVVPIDIANVDETETYLVYNDADGTEHYFKQSEDDSSKYEDEDGLNLTIEKDGTNYTMSDEDGNKKIFLDGYLREVVDADGNKIRIVYTDQQITSLVFAPKSGSEKTIFELEYLAGTNTLFQIKDSVGRKYRFTYELNNGMYQMNQIIRYTGTDNVVARYLYDASNRRMTHAYDFETKTGVQYVYWKSTTGYRIYEYWEYAAASVDGTQTIGAKARTWTMQMRQARYRFSGADGKIDTDDDTITTYLFNSAGQTINARSENETSRRLLGVTASAYTENSGTSKTNNRISESISSGQAGVNLLVNGGFEKYSGTVATGWTHEASGGAVACRENSTANGISYSGKMHYNLYNGSTSGSTSIYKDVAVEQGETYTFSAYVNTAYAATFGSNGGVCLYVYYPGIEEIAKSPVIAYKTDTNIDNGWQRLSVTFTMDYSATVRFILQWNKAYGTMMADDIQLEKGAAASRFNHVYNGSFESAGDGWTVIGGGQVTDVSKKHGNISLKMTASAPETSLYAQQTIELNKSSNTTFLLSAWSLANSIPDLETEIAGEDDTTLKYWGLTLTLNYSDGTKEEYFDLPFCDYATNWQYAATSITPEAVDKIISTATLRLYYQNNANSVYFDSISLIEEPAQTYKYDDEGNLIEIKSSGNGEDDYKYDDVENLINVYTEGSGDYEYKYENEENEHQLTKVINDTITMNFVYDTNGRATATELESSVSGYTMTLDSSAEYGTDDLLVSMTDNTGASTSYTYDDHRRVFTVQDAADAPEDVVYTYYDDVTDRETLSYQSGKISVRSTYAKGRLTKLVRSGYANGSSVSQEYNLAYDDFGKNTAVSIGSQKIMDYSYKDGNGNLVNMAYGGSSSPLAEADYVYDGLDRVESVTYSDYGTDSSVTYGYLYSTDGKLAGISENGELAYSYDYDSLGRLIHSSLIEDGKIVLYTDHEYDTSDRLTTQSWQTGEESHTQSYSYSSKDGTLESAVIDDETITFTYDALKRLSGRTTPRLKSVYSYVNKDNNTKTTTQIASVAYKNQSGTADILPADGYMYDVMGNIIKVTSGTDTEAEYVYDTQNQLVSENRWGGYEDSYVYDTFGNIRSIVKANPGAGVSETYTFSYSTGDWKDQLTGVTYTDYDGKTVNGTLTYDSMGNPLTYFNGHSSWNFTWKYGKQLASAMDGTNTITNTYDVDGIRKSKTVNGVEHKYVTLNKKIMSESYGDITIRYFYDNENRPYKIVVDKNGTTYTGYYVVNWQGDVVAITDSTGKVVVEYTYDAWGNVVSSSYEKIEGLSKMLYDYNALKYRGYYYDADLELYYLNTRFYDPVICRFISADDISILSVDQENFLQYNLYTYCLNNPVNSMDSSGMFPWMFLAKVAIGGAISAISYGISCHASGEEADPWIMCGYFVTGALGSAVGATEMAWAGKQLVDKLIRASASGAGNMIMTMVDGGTAEEAMQAGINGTGFGLLGSMIPGATFGQFGDVSELVQEMSVGSTTEFLCSNISNIDYSSHRTIDAASTYLTGPRAPEGMGLCEYRAKILAEGGFF